MVKSNHEVVYFPPESLLNIASWFTSFYSGPVLFICYRQCHFGQKCCCVTLLNDSAVSDFWVSNFEITPNDGFHGDSSVDVPSLGPMLSQILVCLLPLLRQLSKQVADIFVYLIVDNRYAGKHRLDGLFLNFLNPYAKNTSFSVSL